MGDGDLWKRELLARTHPFSALSARQLDQIAELAEERELPAGGVLCTQGTVDVDTYVVISGEVRVIKDGVELARLGPGELVGEMALIHEGRRSATVKAEAPTKVLALAAEEVDSMLAAVPGLAKGYGERASTTS